MSSGTNVHGTSVERVISSALQPATGAVYVVGPTPAVVESLVEFSVDIAERPSLRLLADEPLLKGVFEDFPTASDAADLIASGALELRVPDGPAENTLLVTDESVVAVVTAGDQVVGLRTDKASFVQSARATYAEAFQSAEQFTLRTPAISAVRESLEAEFEPTVRADFDAVLESLRDRRAAETDLDEVVISLLVAARNELLLYDISRWGEDVGIASKATFSRTKTELEEAGVIETEKVPIDVGRPRLRLRLGDERLRASDTADLAGIAGEILGRSAAE
ncbi:transcriptional regulator TbsP [Halobellus salinisoli]|uniref:transcriptional regulator TbsP n=1 Tax=Halobellus salinisoli TaxID=3108500 RepID=UPI00300A7147